MIRANERTYKDMLYCFSVLSYASLRGGFVFFWLYNYIYTIF